jgi:hypothetical protein
MRSAFWQKYRSCSDGELHLFDPSRVGEQEIHFTSSTSSRGSHVAFL